MALDIEH
jgi:hypothetical protein